MFQAPRGTADILPQDQPYWEHVRTAVERQAGLHGYARIDTPIFEDTRLFHRSVGEETDIVQKETYDFTDRGGDGLTLRPEGTAAVCRAYLEHGMHNAPQPVRLYYFCPMFRYDRPQAGRYRQFHQFGVETIGDADASVDAEVIHLALRMLESAGLRDLTLLLNNMGDPADRAPYLTALREHFRPHYADLGPDGRQRFDRNLLRLLDSKELADKPFFQAAPRSVDFLGAAAKAHWEQLLGYLDRLGIRYRLAPALVRGLDYYTRTVFEIVPQRDGAQSALCAGGRYDGLMELLGGKPTPAVGFAAGIERVILNMRSDGTDAPLAASSPTVIAYRGAEPKVRALTLAAELRAAGVAAVVAPERSLKAQLRYASALGASRVLILGEQELARGVVALRDMSAATQADVPLAMVASALRTPRA